MSVTKILDIFLIILHSFTIQNDIIESEGEL